MRWLLVASLLATAATAEEPGAAPETVALCEFAACALTSTRGVVCWGLGSDGEDYAPDIVRSKTPKAMDGTRDARRITCAYRTACALDAAGGVTCWGRLPGSSEGEAQPVPLHPFAGARIHEVAIVENETLCALTDSGLVVCDPSGADLTHPVAKGARQLVVGSGSLCVTHQNRSVWCGGAFSHDGALGSPLAPEKEVKALGGATSLAVGAEVVCGTVKGRLRCEGPSSAIRSLGLTPWVGKPADRVLFSPSGDSAALVSGRTLRLGGMLTTLTNLTVAPRLSGSGDVAIHGSGLCHRTNGKGVECLGNAASWRVGPAHDSGLVTALQQIALP